MEKKNLKKKAFKYRIWHGVTVIYGGETKKCYDLEQPDLIKHMGKLVDVYYDPTDLSKILISGRGLELVIKENQPIPIRKSIKS